ECNIEGLRILNLLEYDIMYWISVLVQHRTLNSNISGTRLAFEDNLEELKKRYPVRTEDYDMIIGYRADDRYFGFAYDFLAGNIYKEQLEQALISGDLGAQVFIRSEKSFVRLTQIGIEKVPETYTDKAEKRSRAASVRYSNEIRKNQPRNGTSIGMLLWGQSR
ncbi:MAG: DUF3990 domain-containing protein, partial [Clostridiales bacterium]|nr:DUF3990 domain-containing protein [Clostridiales bacterium]